MKIRCSQLGRLMGGFEKPRDALSEEAKSLITEIYIRDVYGRSPVIDSKEMQKGRRVEEDSISLLSRVRGKLYIKNKQSLENDYITGTLDLKVDDTVTDIKSPYTIFTFAKADMSSEYAWQLTGYMWLTGASKAELAYCLVNAPEDMVFDELKRACYATNIYKEMEHEYGELELKVRHNMEYSDIPEAKRVKTFPLLRDEQKIELIKAKHALASDYYNLLKNTL